MAENESLDLRSSKRWAYVLSQILKGEPRSQTSQRILGTMQKAWQKTQQQLLKYGTSLPALIEATLNGDDLSELRRQTRGHDYVRLFQIEQRPFDRAESLLSRVTAAGMDRVLDQLRDHLVGTEMCPNVGTWKQLRGELLAPISGDLSKLADRLAASPAAQIRVARVPALVDAAGSPSLVNMSLLHPIAPGIGAHR